MGLRVGFTWVAAGAVVCVVVASVGAFPAEGARRAVTFEMKEKAWSLACDLPEKAWGKKAGPEIFTDSKGKGYAPSGCKWCSPMELVAGQGRQLMMTLAHSVAPGEKVEPLAGEGWTSAFAFLAVVMGAPPARKTTDKLWRLNPETVAFLRVFLPEPEQKMCSSTAGEVYQRGLAPAVRLYGEALAHSYAKFRTVSAKRLDKAVGARDRGSLFFKRCEAFAQRDTDLKYQRTQACFFWLRRAAAGDRDTTATLLTEILSRYDADHWTTFKRKLPKKLR